MNKNLIDEITRRISGGVTLLTRADIEANYPPRSLPSGAEVTRLCPSPTGFVHIGTIFTALLCERVAHMSDGVFMLRIEDTDKKREVEGAKEKIVAQLQAFGLTPDEGLQPDGSSKGANGPYVQSERRDMYLAFAIDLLQKGRAYPCFATSEELEAAVKDQQAKKLRPGYYGEWALWRDATDEKITEALAADKPFVLRFRSEGSHERRIEFDDVLKGRMSVPENDLDVPLIKSDEHRLPTYHLAHVVDDYLMRATIIMRGEEWLPSTPLHIELAQALGIAPFRYAHTPVISIIGAEGGKRKLSKRKDKEADVAYWLQAEVKQFMNPDSTIWVDHWPIEGIKAYLMGLANSNFEDWYREHPDARLEDFPFSLEKLASSRSPLLDMKKLEDYCADYFAKLSVNELYDGILQHNQGNPLLIHALQVDKEYSLKVLAIERDGEKPRKDMKSWSDAWELYGYFFDDCFAEMSKDPLDVPQEDSAAALAAFMQTYDHAADKDAWFENMKQAAEAAGYALDRKALKENPEKFKGGLADFAKIIRVKLTGKTRTPDLHTIMQVMDDERVNARLR